MKFPDNRSSCRKIICSCSDTTIPPCVAMRNEALYCFNDGANTIQVRALSALYVCAVQYSACNMYNAYIIGRLCNSNTLTRNTSIMFHHVPSCSKFEYVLCEWVISNHSLVSCCVVLCGVVRMRNVKDGVSQSVQGGNGLCLNAFREYWLGGDGEGETHSALWRNVSCTKETRYISSERGSLELRSGMHRQTSTQYVFGFWKFVCLFICFR